MNRAARPGAPRPRPASFDFQPRLMGALLTLRPMARGDFDALFKIAADPAVWAQHPVPELCRREVFQANIDDAFEDEGGVIATKTATREIVGYSRFSQRHCGPDAVEIGWTLLHPRVWGGAHNRDLKQIMLEHAFKTFPRVIFRVGEQNLRSRRALEKIGATENGWRQDIDAFGRVGTRLGYELTKAAFTHGPLGASASAEARR